MLVALEGIDGTGKHTQSAVLVERAAQAGITASMLSFPRYGETVAAEAIRTYLKGGFGRLDTVAPQLAGLLFAVDRFESAQLLTEFVEKFELVVLDRYTASNIAHQASRSPEHQRTIVADWLRRIENDVFGVPRPDLTILLDLDPQRAQAAARERADVDIHEADLSYLQACRRSYLDLAGAEGWQVVRCDTPEGRRHSIAEVADAVWIQVERMLMRTRTA